MIDERSQIAPSAPAQSRGHQSHRLSVTQCQKDIWTLSRCRNTDCNIIGFSDRLNLPGEDLLETEIIAACGQGRTVGGQRNGRYSRAVVAIADGKLCGDVLSVPGAASVAKQQ